MKQSGIDWIGEIPDGWEIYQLSQLVKQVKNKNSLLQEMNLLSLSYGSIKRKDINSSDGLLPASFDGYNIIENGDIVLRLTDLQNDHTSLRVGRTSERGIITSAYTTLHPININHSKFLYYMLHSFDLKKGFYGMGAGVRQGLNYDEVKSLKVPLPPLAEQQKIASYLDKKISQIDAIITEAKQSIEEYKAWKQSVIFEAVTGKNKSGAKKDSGIEWIGEIPEGWSTIKFKYLHSGSNVGESIDKELCNDNENDTVFYTAGLNPIHTIYKQFPVWKYTKQNDLLLARNGTPYVYNPLTNAVYSDHIIRVTIKEDYSKKYVQYAIQQSIFNIVVDTVSITTWSASLWNNQFIPLPPRNIQEKIVEIIENKLNKINSLVLEKESLIADLTEYKKSLIFEVVTGKRSV